MANSADWDEFAETYETKFEPTTGFVLDQFLAYVDPGAGRVVADVGCGPGIVAIACAGLGASVRALDISAGMVGRLLERASEQGLAALVEGVVGDAAALPFADDECDAAVSNFGLIFCPEIDGALRELARVTAPGGQLMISAWTTEARNGWRALLPEDYESTLGFAIQPRPMYRWQSADELSDACTAAGWADVAVEAVEGEQTHLASAAEMRNVFETPPSRAAVSALSEAQFAELCDFLVERAQELFGDGEVALPREAWLVRARA